MKHAMVQRAASRTLKHTGALSYSSKYTYGATQAAQLHHASGWKKILQEECEDITCVYSQI